MLKVGLEFQNDLYQIRVSFHTCYRDHKCTMNQTCYIYQTCYMSVGWIKSIRVTGFFSFIFFLSGDVNFLGAPGDWTHIKVQKSAK